MRFEELNLDPRLLQAIAERGYTETTDVQKRTLAVTLEQRRAVESELQATIETINRQIFRLHGIHACPDPGVTTPGQFC